MATPVEAVEAQRLGTRQHTADGEKLKDPRGTASHAPRSLSSFQNIAQCGND